MEKSENWEIVTFYRGKAKLHDKTAERGND